MTRTTPTGTTTRPPDRFVRREGWHVAHAHLLLSTGEPGLRSECGRSDATPVDSDLYSRWTAAPRRRCKLCDVDTVGCAWEAFDWSAAWERGYGRRTSSRASWLPDLPWPKGLTTLVANDGYSREIHAFDLSDELELSWCRGVNTNEIEVREVIGPDPTMCRRCLRLRAEAAGIDPGPMTMGDVADERHAKTMERIVRRRVRAL